MEKDKHHILFTKRDWRNTEQRLKLRESEILIPEITRDLHEKIHKNCPPVVPLDNDSMNVILKEFDPKDYSSTLTAISELQLAIEKMIKDSRTHELQAEAGGIVIDNLSIQRELLIGELGKSTLIIVDFKRRIRTA